MDETTRSIKIIERTLNSLELIFILLVLLMTLVFQFVYGELPCPLCLLQRVGFLMIATGFLLNLRLGLRPSHYALVILSCLFTAFVALRQIALHVIPGSGQYGSAILGLHMYTWSFIISMAILIATTIFMSIDRQYRPDLLLRKAWQPIAILLLLCVLVIAGINVIFTFAECGLNDCPENPTSYLFDAAKK